jgi:peptidoglycan/LPS O-acetylase OafA/YrhL
MVSFVLIFIALSLIGVKKSNKCELMARDNSDILRGLFCLIVVLVHIPTEFQNRIQDMIGSFAQVGVTFFFMTSAYGLKFGVMNKPDYLKRFWKSRLVNILLPMVFLNIVGYLVDIIRGGGTTLRLLQIDRWVLNLLVFYMLFWIVYRFISKHQDIILIACVVLASIISMAFDITQIWTTEILGLVYGLMVASKFETCKKWLCCRYNVKLVAVGIIAALLGGGYLKFKPVPFWGSYLLKILMCVTILAFVLMLTSKIEIGNRVTRFLGRISYEVYLAHGLVFTALAMTAITNSGLFVSVSLMITVAVAFVIKKLCDAARRYIFER